MRAAPGVATQLPDRRARRSSEAAPSAGQPAATRVPRLLPMLLRCCCAAALGAGGIKPCLPTLLEDRRTPPHKNPARMSAAPSAAAAAENAARFVCAASILDTPLSPTSDIICSVALFGAIPASFICVNAPSALS